MAEGRGGKGKVGAGVKGGGRKETDGRSVEQCVGFGAGSGGGDVAWRIRQTRKWKKKGKKE